MATQVQFPRKKPEIKPPKKGSELGKTIGSAVGGAVGALGFYGGPAIGMATTGAGIQAGGMIGGFADKPAEQGQVMDTPVNRRVETINKQSSSGVDVSPVDQSKAVREAMIEVMKMNDEALSKELLPQFLQAGGSLAQSGSYAMGADTNINYSGLPSAGF
jgi:uncharacterized protein YcfJ